MKNTIQKTIDHAMSLGADSCDVIVNAAESMSLSAQDGKLDKYKVSNTSILGVRVIKNKRIGLAYSESFDADALEFAAMSAVENSAYSDINELETITVKNPTDYIKKNKLTKDESSIEEKIEFALKLESEVKKRDARVQTIPYSGLSIAESKSYYLNSLGTYTEVHDNYLSAYTSALVKEADRTATHSGSTMGRALSQLSVKECVDVALEHSINWLSAKPVATGKYDVIFHPDILAEMLSAFSNYFSAKAAIEKTNPWENKINQAVAIDGFSLIDVPSYKEAFTEYHVDSEGMIKKDLSLIENGVLKSFYHNTVTAKHFKTTSTGHAYRGPRSSLNVTRTNWLIPTGSTTESDMTEGTYLEIIDVMGLGSGDNISGEFSFGASGYLCKDGKRIQPVKEITVAGNFNKLLMDISRMGRELKHNSSLSVFSPTIRFSHLSVAGK